jgi:hypothetical protein
MCPRTFPYNIYSLAHGVWVMEVKTFAFLIPRLTTYLAWRIGSAALPTLLWPPRAFCKILVRTTYTFDMSLYLPHTSPFSLSFPFPFRFLCLYHCAFLRCPWVAFFPFLSHIQRGRKSLVYVKSNLPVLVYLGWASKKEELWGFFRNIETQGGSFEPSPLFCRIRITAAFPFLAKKKGEGFGITKAVNRAGFPWLASSDGSPGGLFCVC